MEIPLRLGDPATYEEATESMILSYNYADCPAPPARVAGALAEYFRIPNVFFDAGVAGVGPKKKGSIRIEWPKHRAQRKPIKMTLKAGITLNVEPARTYRASGDSICEICGEEFRNHSVDKSQRDWDGNTFLRILCNGDRVKL